MRVASLDPQPATVDTLLQASVRMVEDERSRGASTDTKVGQLVGFAGVILSIDVALGSGAFEHSVSPHRSEVFVAFFLVSLLALVIAAYVAIRGVLLPKKTLALRPQDLDRLAGAELVLADSVKLKHMLIRTYGRELVAERRRNDRRLSVANRASLLLTVGVIAVAAEGATLTVEHSSHLCSAGHAVDAQSFKH
ncbi:MAG TPA: hypothetical protein VN845_13185 [Solirubrobacteraceae bacterium]|nr:hypothetical protein [Solirubrobacteraceae bacterium]